MNKVRDSMTALSTTQGISAADKAQPAKDTHVLNSVMFRPLVLAVVAVQVLWALIIPIKNVVIIPFPKFRSDELSTSTQAYSGYNSLLNVTYSGPEVLQVLRDVLAISLSNTQVRSIFEQKADFAIDELGQVLSTQDHATLTKYYTLVFQSSEFPGGRYTVRSEKIAVVQPNGSKLYYTIGCAESQTLLSGTTCVDA